MRNANFDVATEHAQEIAKYIDRLLNGAEPRNVGFSLLFFPLDTPPSEKTIVNYVGNCQRADMLVAMKEMLARWEGQPEVEGHA